MNMNTVSLVVRYVQQHPGCKHSSVIGQAADRDGQQRRRDALAFAVSARYIVRSAKRPWTYTPAVRQPDRIQYAPVDVAPLQAAQDRAQHQ